MLPAGISLWQAVLPAALVRCRASLALIVGCLGVACVQLAGSSTPDAYERGKDALDHKNYAEAEQELAAAEVEALR